MLIVVRRTNGAIPDLFYFAEYETGNVVYRGKRYVCLCAYSATVDFSQMPDEFKDKPWAWNPYGKESAGSGRVDKRWLADVLLGRVENGEQDDPYKFPVSERHVAFVESYVREADVVDYAEFMASVKFESDASGGGG